MAFFQQGKHSIANRKRRRGKEAPESGIPRRRPKAPPKQEKLPSRVALNSPAARFFASIRRGVKILSPRPDSLLGYIPLSLFVSISVASLGIYPYIWLWGNLHAFEKSGAQGLDKVELAKLSVIGFCAQLLVPLSLLSALLGTASGIGGFQEFAFRAIVVYVVVYLLFVLPLRCFNYFNIRWKIREAVNEWDHAGMMIGRTMQSWVKLFCFGSFYIQYHINRLMGLGMHGFADESDLMVDLPITEFLKEYLRKDPSEDDEIEATDEP